MASKNMKRNRHTGRVNAYKAQILETGHELHDRAGRRYRAVFKAGARGPSVVRVFR